MLKTLLTAVLLATSALGADEPTPEALFQKGLADYQAKKFSEARDSFQQILDAGRVTPEVLHNTALANYQLGDRPRALALWRKALNVDPGFSRARAGRDFAENELQLRGWERDGFTQWIQRTLEFLSFRETLWMIALLLGISGWLWLRYFGARLAALEEERPLPAFPTAALVLSLVFTMVVALSVLKARSDWRARATLVVANASARSLPSESGVGLFELRGGTEVLVRRRDKEWLQVQNSEGASGWLKVGEVLITSGR